MSEWGLVVLFVFYLITLHISGDDWFKAWAYGNLVIFCMYGASNLDSSFGTVCFWLAVFHNGICLLYKLKQKYRIHRAVKNFKKQEEKLEITPFSEGEKALLELNKGSLPKKKLQQIVEKWDRRPDKNMKKILRDIRRANMAMSARALLMAGIIFGILIYAIPYIAEN